MNGVVTIPLPARRSRKIQPETAFCVAIFEKLFNTPFLPVWAFPILNGNNGHNGAVHLGISANWNPIHSIQNKRIALIGVRDTSFVLSNPFALIVCLIAIFLL